VEDEMMDTRLEAAAIVRTDDVCVEATVDLLRALGYTGDDLPSFAFDGGFCYVYVNATANKVILLHVAVHGDK
jgi:hypothetical protein